MAAPHIAPAPIVCIGIKRVSLQMQVANYSLEHQGQKFKALEQKFQCSIPEELMLDDAGFSGTTLDRPGIKEALRRIRAGRANAVAFPYIDRFARNLEFGLQMIRTFREAGAKVLLGDYGFVKDTGAFKIQMNLGLMIAEYQADEIREKSRGGVLTKIQKGLAHGARAPFGWRFVTGLELAAQAMKEKRAVDQKPQNYFAAVIEDQATVRLIGQLALDGYTARGICRELALRGVKTHFGKLRWTPEVIKFIVNNEVYSTGVAHWNKTESFAPKKLRKPDAPRRRQRTVQKLRDRSEWLPQKLMGGPIWTPAQQKRICEALKRNGMMKSGRPAKPQSEGGRVALLSGLVICKRCGFSVVPVHRANRAPHRRADWYRCSNKNRTTHERICNCRSIGADILEDAVYNAMGRGLTVELDVLLEKRADALAATEDGAELDTLRAREQKLIAKQKDAAKRAILEDDEDVKRTYSDLVVELKAELALLRRRIANTTGAMETERVDTSTIKRQVKTALRTQDRAAKRALLVAWVQQVRWADDDVTITLRIPVASSASVFNCQHLEREADTYILLDVVEKLGVAA